jgi:hypothetical protein
VAPQESPEAVPGRPLKGRNGLFFRFDPAGISRTVLELKPSLIWAQLDPTLLLSDERMRYMVSRQNLIRIFLKRFAPRELLLKGEELIKAAVDVCSLPSKLVTAERMQWDQMGATLSHLYTASYYKVEGASIDRCIITHYDGNLRCLSHNVQQTYDILYNTFLSTRKRSRCDFDDPSSLDYSSYQRLMFCTYTKMFAINIGMLLTNKIAEYNFAFYFALWWLCFNPLRSSHRRWSTI